MIPDPAITSLDEGWPRPLQALWWLKKGDLKVGQEWDRAHALCQVQEGEVNHDWVHALVHWIEGDDWNSGYWYRSAGKERIASTIQAEWSTIAKAMVSEMEITQ